MDVRCRWRIEPGDSTVLSGEADLRGRLVELVISKNNSL